MSLIQESFQRLFPERTWNYEEETEYNRRLSDFNANISLRHQKIKINMNLQWKDIDDEIKIGLIQHLLLKILKKKGNTHNIDLYNNFVKNIDILTVKDNFDPLLEKSFDRLNALFFDNTLEKPNLIWGKESFRKLASYNFHNDTIVMSTIFKDEKQKMLDHVMYHELLHKFFKFAHNNGRNSFHSPEFRRAERKFPYFHEIEREIGQLIRTKKRMKTIRENKQHKNGSLWDFIKKF
ncbi:hypothetical protein COV12_00730 [Candidatus Woesearchaeota archaeon CG10_big_fil_rev_8_21_14_0_10_32_24]|nr:MAG: hypothetical protein COV12_00730 [Candidatus Woesearchaeota archaeon CG10_big_fil_rev_8_21_14_0_10_32_24]